MANSKEANANLKNNEIFMDIEKTNEKLLNDLVGLIEESRKQLSYVANATLSYTYW